MDPIGLGTYMLPREKVAETIRKAFEVGYRRIDCAPVYFNEDVIGDAIAGYPRDQLYLVSKLASPFHRHVEQALRKTLNDLRTDYLDLYLIHWPVAFHYVPIDPTERGWKNEDIDDSGNGSKIDDSVSIHETWRQMEEMVDMGLVRSIGVSNFPVALLHELMTRARIPPVVNQCEGHPFLQNQKLVDYCARREVHFQAYSPLGTPGVKESDEPSILEDPILVQIAQKHNATVAQVCLAWARQRGTSVVAKATSPEHLEENWKSLELELTEEDVHEISQLDRGYRFFRPDEWWPNAAMAVFD